jgi:hypothetical protein
MAIDRAKFKPASVTKMQEADTQLNELTGRSNQGRAGMLKITNGKNVFRIYPAHPDETLPEDDQPGFSEPSVKTFLPMMVDERDGDGKATGKKKEGSRPIFNSRVHGDTPKDLVEEYIKLARKVAESDYDTSTNEGKIDKQKFLDKIYGKFSKIASERLMGIQYKTNHVMYADKIVGENREFGRLGVKESIKVRLNQIAASEAEGEAMGVDPFTDLDDGRAIVITYNENSTTPAGYYITNLDTDIDKVTKMAKFYPIDDDRLEEFSKQTPLRAMYKNVFTRKDFELQLQGLEFFDAKNKMDLTEREEWVAILEEISEYYPHEVESAEQEETTPTELPEGVDEFTDMNRAQLKIYISTNKLGILIKPAYTEDDIRDLVREALNESLSEPKPEPEVAVEEPKKEVAKPAALSAKDRIAALRGKK